MPHRPLFWWSSGPCEWGFTQEKRKSSNPLKYPSPVNSLWALKYHIISGVLEVLSVCLQCECGIPEKYQRLWLEFTFQCTTRNKTSTDVSFLWFRRFDKSENATNVQNTVFGLFDKSTTIHIQNSKKLIWTVLWHVHSSRWVHKYSVEQHQRRRLKGKQEKFHNRAMFVAFTETISRISLQKHVLPEGEVPSATKWVAHPFDPVHQPNLSHTMVWWQDTASTNNLNLKG